MLRRMVTDGIHSNRNVEVLHHEWTASVASRDEVAIRAWFKSFVGFEGTAGGAYPLKVRIKEKGERLTRCLHIDTGEKWEEFIPEILKDLVNLEMLTIVIWKGVWEMQDNIPSFFRGSFSNHICILQPLIE